MDKNLNIPPSGVRGLAKILLLDDHFMVLEGLKSILTQSADIEIIATAVNAFDAHVLLKKHPEINLVLTDINLPDVSGIEFCAKVKKEFPHIQVIGISTFKQRSYVSQMMQNGASGYVVKSANAEEIIFAIREVLNGKFYFSSEINTAENIILPDSAPALTRREKEILSLIAQGLTNNDIAEKLFLSPYTVDTHRKNLLFKFEVANTAQLIKKATEVGLV
ncbi:DNA-binding response regulator [Emticicia aquatilis]|uniref:DNA-binding response regulator n=1 Tax=Emticicia aquatilis TaxID=1537369 RepID=A0A916YFG7_9BACT|nr:response regulator transcription factor [Emticicia aquatilis]GGD42531.1 DNA-binding response regulator [Emticicia aquatilis]